MNQKPSYIRRFLKSPFIAAVCVFLVLTPGISYCLNKALPYWGNPSYAFKYDYYRENREHFNTVIFGTSRVYAQFDPKAFDQALTAEQITSFNLGMYGAYHPEVYFLYEKFLEKDVSNIRYALIELTGFDKIEREKRWANRTVYWLNLKDLSYVYSHIASARWRKDHKPRQITYFLSGYLSKLYSMNRYIEAIREYFEGGKKGHREFFAGKERNGFVSIDSVLPYDTAGQLIARRAEFENNASQLLEERFQSAQNYFDLSKKNLPLNHVHLNKIKQLIKTSADKGIHLIFFVPPKHKNYHEIKRLARLIPAEHFIELVDPLKYPELYKYEYTFDKGHLNAEGAEIFSRYFAAAFRDKLKNHSGYKLGAA